MPRIGPDYETVILLKLGAMEGLLKSFMSSLKEPLQRKGGESYPIVAKVNGTIIWEASHGESVGEGQPLGAIETDDGAYWDVSSPASGFLFIKSWAETGMQVGRGRTIATVEKNRALV